MRPHLNKRLPLVLTIITAGFASLLPAAEEKVLHVYTHRHYASDELLHAAFTKATGIEVKVTAASADQLISRLEGEGADTKADVLITVDAGRLVKAKSIGVLQPAASPLLAERVPAAWRDPENHWFTFAMRSRIIVTAKDRVPADAIKTYADLADPKWRGKLLMRAADNNYNISLLASVIAHEGEEKAIAWTKGIGANLARKPIGGDREQVVALSKGLGDVAVVNSYYLGQMSESKDQAERDAFASVRVIFPDQDGRGAHMNVSGGGITKHAKHPENARRFLEFLVSAEAQKAFPATSFEFPVAAEVPLCPLLASWGPFKRDALSLADLAGRYQDAVRVIEDHGW
jgi:iron(III) transport system substrate-binding protein